VRRHARLCLALFALALPAGPLAAQEPADRAAVDRFRDSLGAITDVAVLNSIVAREKTARPATGDREIARLRYGWALVRLGQVADSAPPLVDALLQFYEAGVRRSKWPYAHFGLGATKLALDVNGAREIRSQHQTAGSGWRWGAANAFLSTVRSDTTYITAAVELGLTVMRTPTWADIPPVVTAMTRAAKSGQAGNEVWLVLGRLHRQIDSNEAALRSFDVYAGLPGVDKSLAQLERARTLFALGRNQEAERAYFSGAAFPSDSSRELYIKDASWIADSSEIREIRAASGEQLPAVLGRLWRDRETASGRAAGSRLSEHYRRWDVAQRKYRLQPAIVRQWDFGQIYRSAQSDLDDRGVIYMKHGDPDEKAFFIQDGVPPNESWVYHRPAGDLVLHFTQTLSSSGWHLIEGLGQMSGNPCQVPGLLESRVMIDPYYQVLADMARQDSIKIAAAFRSGDNAAAQFFAACSPGELSPVQSVSAVIGVAASVSTQWFNSQRQTQERLASRANIEKSTTSDSDPLRYRAPFAPFVQAYGVGGPRAGSGRLLVIWALDGRDRPKADTIPGVQGLVYSTRVRANVFDTAGKLVVSIDSIKRQRYAAGILPSGSQINGLLTLDVPPGIYRIQLSVADTLGDKGAARVLGGIPVPAFNGALELSDLMLGLEGSAPVWVRGPGSRFSFNARNAWTPAEAMEVGFEMEGLPAGQAYKVKIAVADLGADSTRPPRASVEFENQASGTRELVTQSLGLRALRPGRYLLTVTVTAGDRSIRRERRITISPAR
jgi:GWxTD domain-containing protein